MGKPEGLKVPKITRHALNMISTRGLKMEDIADTLINGELFEGGSVIFNGTEEYRWKIKGPEVTLILNHDRTVIITAFQSAWREVRNDRRKKLMF